MLEKKLLDFESDVSEGLVPFCSSASNPLIVILLFLPTYCTLGGYFLKNREAFFRTPFLTSHVQSLLSKTSTYSTSFTPFPLYERSGIRAAKNTP